MGERLISVLRYHLTLDMRERRTGLWTRDVESMAGVHVLHYDVECPTETHGFEHLLVALFWEVVEPGRWGLAGRSRLVGINLEEDSHLWFQLVLYLLPGYRLLSHAPEVMCSATPFFLCWMNYNCLKPYKLLLLTCFCPVFCCSKWIR